MSGGRWQVARGRTTGALAAAVSGVLCTFAGGAALEVPVGGMDITSSADAPYETATIHGPLVLNGADVAVTNVGVVNIGPDVGDNASVVATNGARFVLAKTASVVYGANGGKGGTVIVSSDSNAIDWNPGIRCGTFGGAVVHTVSEKLTSETGVFDLAKMLPQGWFGIRRLHTRNKAVKTRLLFNGGTLCLKEGERDDVVFMADAETEIVLEGVGDSTLSIYDLHNDKVFLGGEGRLTVKGKGALERAIGSAPFRSTTSLGGDIRWENAGGLVVKGKNHWLKTTSDDVLPYKAGGLTVKPGAGGFAELNGTVYHRINALDLNGTRQRVYTITLEDDVGLEGEEAIVTNSSPTRAVLEIGEFATETLALDGVFSGPIDVVVKSARVTYGPRFTLTNGARLFSDRTLHNASVGALVPQNEAFAGTLCVSNWTANVETNAAYVLNGARRDRAPSRVKTLALAPGAAVDVQGGALGVAHFSGAADARVHVRAGCTLGVYAQAGVSCRFLRFVFKEAYGVAWRGRDRKFFPQLRRLCFVTERGDDYWPRDGGAPFVLADPATAPTDMPSGSYMFHTDKFANGKGPDLDTVNAPTTWPENSCRDTNYNFNDHSFLESGSASGLWGGLLFTNAVPNRADDKTWHTITFRLKDDGPKLAGYRFYSNWNTYCYPICWTVEASDNGVAWKTLDEKTDYYCFTYGNPSGLGKNFEGYNEWNAWKGATRFPFCWTRAVADQVSFSLDGATLRVDRDGVLDVAQTERPVEVAALEIDAQAGGGRVTHFRPAEGGVLKIVNAAQAGALAAAERMLPFTFDALDAPENFGTWKVTVNGQAANFRVCAAEGGLKVSETGCVILVR